MIKIPWYVLLFEFFCILIAYKIADESKRTSSELIQPTISPSKKTKVDKKIMIESKRENKSALSSFNILKIIIAVNTEHVYKKTSNVYGLQLDMVCAKLIIRYRNGLKKTVERSSVKSVVAQ